MQTKRARRHIKGRVKGLHCSSLLCQKMAVPSDQRRTQIGCPRILGQTRFACNPMYASTTYWTNEAVVSRWPGTGSCSPSSGAGVRHFLLREHPRGRSLALRMAVGRSLALDAIRREGGPMPTRSASRSCSGGARAAACDVFATRYNQRLPINQTAKIAMMKVPLENMISPIIFFSILGFLDYLIATAR